MVGVRESGAEEDGMEGLLREEEDILGSSVLQPLFPRFHLLQAKAWGATGKPPKSSPFCCCLHPIQPKGHVIESS